MTSPDKLDESTNGVGGLIKLDSKEEKVICNPQRSDQDCCLYNAAACVLLTEPHPTRRPTEYCAWARNDGSCRRCVREQGSLPAPTATSNLLSAQLGAPVQAKRDIGREGVSVEAWRPVGGPLALHKGSWVLYTE